MRAAFLVFSMAATATEACLPNAGYVFHDMHDGDEKGVYASEDAVTFQIFPGRGSNESWTVYGKFDYDTCTAAVDFNVKGKPNPPPVKLNMTLYSMASAAGDYQIGLEFTDPSSTLAPATQPLNLWISHWKLGGPGRKATQPRAPCIDIPPSEKLLFNDMHDGDMKDVAVDGDTLTITPHSSTESWKVTSKFDANCVASIDFNVPGKPGPPPVALEATVWMMSPTPAGRGKEKVVLLFTDPSSTIAPATATLNAWVPN